MNKNADFADIHTPLLFIVKKKSIRVGQLKNGLPKNFSRGAIFPKMAFLFIFSYYYYYMLWISSSSSGVVVRFFAIWSKMNTFLRHIHF